MEVIESCVSRTDTPMLLLSSVTPYVKMLVKILVNENWLAYPQRWCGTEPSSTHCIIARKTHRQSVSVWGQTHSLTLRWSSLKAEEDLNSIYNNWNEFFDGVKLCLLFQSLNLKVSLLFIETENTFCDKWKLQKSNRGKYVASQPWTQHR